MACDVWRLNRRGESKQALPAITAGKIIKEKVFPVSVPSGKVSSISYYSLLWTRCRLKAWLPS